MLTRRTLLAGGGVAVAAGAAGTIALGPRKVFHQLGIVHSPDGHVPPSGWAVQSETLASEAMHRDVRLVISRPPGEATGVVLCLHGRNNDERLTFDTIKVHDVVASVGASLAVVSVDGGSHSYWHRRSDGTDALAMILDELVPAVDAALGAVLPKAVMGWSMGGYGALLVGERAPTIFRAVVACGPALWPDFAHASKGAFDSAQDFAEFDVFAGAAAFAGSTVRIDCGTDDAFVGEARRFAASLPAPNPGGFSSGFHDHHYFRSVCPAEIATIAAGLT